MGQIHSFPNFLTILNDDLFFTRFVSRTSLFENLNTTSHCYYIIPLLKGHDISEVTIPAFIILTHCNDFFLIQPRDSCVWRATFNQRCNFLWQVVRVYANIKRTYCPPCIVRTLTNDCSCTYFSYIIHFTKFTAYFTRGSRKVDSAFNWKNWKDSRSICRKSWKKGHVAPMFRYTNGTSITAANREIDVHCRIRMKRTRVGKEVSLERKHSNLTFKEHWNE